MTATSGEVRCAFCGAGTLEASKLIAGPEECICDACVRRCTAHLTALGGEEIAAHHAACTFCGKARDEVRGLISSPGDAAICDECIDLCNDILAAPDGSAEAPGEAPRGAPPALRPGDRIAVAAPAGAFDPEELLRGVERIRARGYEVVYDESIFERERYLAGSDERRAREFLRWLKDPEVRAVFCARGGYGSARMLEWMVRNEDLVGSPDDDAPKIIVGYSDLTYLLSAFSRLAGWVTFHGPQVAVDLGREEDPESLDALLGAVSGERFPGSFQEKPLEGLVPGTGTGRLVGGCLSIVVTLGSQMLMRRPAEPYLLFIEEIGEPAYRIDRMLTQLRTQMPTGSLRGVVIGHLKDVRDPPGGTIRDVLMDRLGDLGVPVAMGLEAGHGRPNRTLPLGVHAQLDADQGTLRILEPVVRTDDAR